MNWTADKWPTKLVRGHNGTSDDDPAGHVTAASSFGPKLYRRLVRENHPDSLMARGVPPEFVKRATEKVASINAAWDRIKRERGL